MINEKKKLKKKKEGLMRYDKNNDCGGIEWDASTTAECPLTAKIQVLESHCLFLLLQTQSYLCCKSVMYRNSDTIQFRTLLIK